MQAFFPDSCKSRACRIASMPVDASKLHRGAAALSSLLPLTGRFITSELCTDHTSVRQAVSASLLLALLLQVEPPGRGLHIFLAPGLFIPQ